MVKYPTGKKMFFNTKKNMKMKNKTENDERVPTTKEQHVHVREKGKLICALGSIYILREKIKNNEPTNQLKQFKQGICS